MALQILLRRRLNQELVVYPYLAGNCCRPVRLPVTPSTLSILNFRVALIDDGCAGYRVDGGQGDSELGPTWTGADQIE